MSVVVQVLGGGGKGLGLRSASLAFIVRVSIFRFCDFGLAFCLLNTDSFVLFRFSSLTFFHVSRL